MSSGLWRPPDKRVRRPDGGTAPHKDRGIGSSNGDGASSPSAAAAKPRLMTLRSFRALKRNTLVGFAITLPVGQFDLELDEITLHQQGDRFWVGLPVRPMVNSDESGSDLSDIDAEIYLYQLGDLDPSGTQAAEAIEKDLRGFAPLAEIHFERIGIKPEQIIKFELQAALRPTKRSDPRYRRFCNRYRDVAVLQGGQLSCELDAIRPTDLRELVRGAIERHLPRERLDMMNARGEQEKLQIGRMLDRYLDELHEPAPITVGCNDGASNGHWITEYLSRA